MTSPTPVRIGIIVCSTRPTRNGPTIASFLTQTILTARPSTSSTPYTLNIIDLASHDLPLYNEPNLAAYTPDPADYAHEHTRAWSAEVASYDAFIFLCPQYNWGYPAVIKNAIDYLYHEWAGKGAAVVSYGSRGGGRGAAQLRQVCQGVHMKLAQGGVELAYGKEETYSAAVEGGVEGIGKLWEGKKGEIVAVFQELVDRNVGSTQREA